MVFGGTMWDDVGRAPVGRVAESMAEWAVCVWCVLEPSMYDDRFVIASSSTAVCRCLVFYFFAKVR